VFLDRLDAAGFERRFAAVADEAARLLESAGIARRDITFVRRLDMRYRGQGYQVDVVLPAERDAAATLAALPGLFEAAYKKVFAIAFPGQVLEIVHWKVEAIGPAPSLPAAGFRFADLERRGPSASRKASRVAWFPEAADFVECAVHDRYALRPSEAINGPALIEDKESTCVVGVGDRVEVDAQFNLIASVARGVAQVDSEAQAVAAAAGAG
jgi:N-methylhydantoinase A/oxoprolinase/acetone carboxylase beta subunit